MGTVSLSFSSSFFFFLFGVFIKESQYQRYDRPITLMDQRRILRPCSTVL